ncbi:MAG: ATP-dependent DNA helicase [Myxococcota bacterium]
MMGRHDLASGGWEPAAREALEPWLDRVGPIAIAELEAGGAPARFATGAREIALVLLEAGGGPPGTRVLKGKRGSAGSSDPLAALSALASERTLVALEADAVRAFLARIGAPALAPDALLDVRSLFALCRPDAPDLELDTLCALELDRPARPDALGRALDVGLLLAAVARGARAGVARHREVAEILATRLPRSPWRALLDPPAAPGAASAGFDFARFARAAFVKGRTDGEAGAARGSGSSASRGVSASPRPSPTASEERYLAIGASGEEPVPFELGAIVAALADVERGARHFPGYRVRKEQIELARQFVHVLQDGGVAKLEGGTGVGKSLAYLAAVIPFAMARAAQGERGPVVLSTRTKLLQDQLLEKDIAAAARFLGHPQLRALSIKGRANYVCERRLAAVLSDAGDPALRAELQADVAQLEACARIRPAGEVGTVPAVLLRRHPRLRELLRASVAVRADQCSREQCGHEKRCPFGRHRRALARAQLVVANHDLLLRWPPDYPAFAHVVVDEGHELGGVAEEVYALRVRPEEIEERIDELFGAPARRGLRLQRYASRGLVARSASRSDEQTRERNREDLRLELAGLGRAMTPFADAWGGAELPSEAGRARPQAAQLAANAAQRLEALAQLALREGPARRFASGESSDGAPIEGLRDHAAEEEGMRAIVGHVDALLAAAGGLRTAFASEGDAYVGHFEGLESPFDRWSLVLRPVDPGPAFEEAFLGRVESLAIVSATLFVGGDDHAALGTLGLADSDAPTHFQYSVPSPFPYAEAMRVVALSGEADLVEQTAESLAILARALGGRTLGLFTSLARMREVAERLAPRLEAVGLELLAPLRAGDDPGGLVERFRRLGGRAVMLGSRRYWQGIDVRGDDLQALVIEKLPFEVPTELQRRRDARLRAVGDDPFERAAVGQMLLHLKQMVGRLIRSETDRGLVVIVDARRGRRYFRRLVDALPDGVAIEEAGLSDLPRIVDELGLGEVGPGQSDPEGRS